MKTMDIDVDQVKPEDIKNRKDGFEKIFKASSSHLKALVKREGPLKIADYTYGKFQKDSSAYDCEVVFENFKREILDKMSNDDDKEVVGDFIDRLKLIDIGTTALDKAIKKDGVIAKCAQIGRACVGKECRSRWSPEH